MAVAYRIMKLTGTVKSNLAPARSAGGSGNGCARRTPVAAKAQPCDRMNSANAFSVASET